MQTLTLTIPDRLILPAILPQQGGRVQMTLTKHLLDQVEFTPDEITLFELRDEPGGLVRYNPDTAQHLDIDLTPDGVALLKKASAEVDEQGRVTRDMLPLLEKIDQL